MAVRTRAGAQFLFSRIAVVLILTIGSSVSQTAAKPQSRDDQLKEIETEQSNIEVQESYALNASASFADTAFSLRKRVTRADLSRYVETPGVGRHIIHTRARTWHDARKICQEEGGDLAVINSEAESLNLAELVAKSYPHYDSYWDECVLVGFNDIDQEDVYVTIDGRTLEEAGFAKWGPQQPDKSEGNEDCGSILKDGSLNDALCDRKFAFACELPLVDEVEETSRAEKPDNMRVPNSGSNGVEGLMILLWCPFYLLARSL